MDELIKRLRNCATQAAPCKTCDMIEDGFCSDTLMKQAADAIETLNEFIQRQLVSIAMMNKLRWIPVSERLPKEEETVLTWGKEHQCILLDWMHDNKWCCFGGADYWMPLPKAPEKESES